MARFVPLADAVGAAFVPVLTVGLALDVFLIRVLPQDVLRRPVPPPSWKRGDTPHRTAPERST